ncbi:MAG TPA: UDP binding domain-containing protein [Candidatus Contendobacter sp.]|nr:UDP binding domain-containing protein [Candidatus Contendobacter sp.]HRD49130.1 UDP binding domain-containing protein [Candidatus Contendobacter sp.]
MSIQVGFVGMTHLGLVSATGVASKGFEVVCYDPDPGLIARLRAGALPVLEPGLDGLIAAHRDRQRFTTQISELVACHVVYIAPDVPTDDRGCSNLAGINRLIETVLPNLGATAILVVLCQAPPGFTRSLPMPASRLYYQVETLIFGQAVERATEPERFIVGCADPRVPLPTSYRQLLEAFGCPILLMRYESAELAKISINMCLVASVSVANTLAEVCENIGADWSEIVPALRLDRRIGPYSYLNPGLGIAGGNLERDLSTVLNLSMTHGTDGGVVAAWIANSERRKEWSFATLRSEVLDRKPNARIGVLGLAYKENTHSTKNSPALALLRHLEGNFVTVHDPAVSAAACGLTVMVADEPLQVAENADAVAIMTPWPIYKELDPQILAARMAGRTIMDPYRVLQAEAVVAAGLDYVTLGAPPQRARLAGSV